MHVTHVKSNFKGGIDVDLGYRTLVVGPNGSGKSCITQSIEFALTGRVSDVVGRATVAEVNQLLTLGPGDSIFAEATYSEGMTTRCESKGKKITPAPYPSAFPLREVREALAGSVETVRKFFLRLTAGAVTPADVESRIPGPYRELFGQVIAPTRADTAPVDLLLFALERAKGRARELSAEAKASAAVVTETTGGVQPVSEPDLTSARTMLVAARTETAQLSEMLRRAHQVADLAQEEEAAHARVTSFTAQLSSIPPPAEADRVREELAALLGYARDKGLSTCPCCRQEHHREDYIEPFTLDFWAERLSSVAAKRTERAKELAQYNAARAALDIAEHAHAQAVARLGAIGTEITERVADIAAIEVQLSNARYRADVAEQQVIQLERAAATWEQARKARDAAAEREIQATKWSQLADACSTAVGSLMDTAVGAFTARVQKYLPHGDHFALTLHDGEREVCRFGFLRELGRAFDGGLDQGQRLDTALSGAEWARLCVALAAAVADSESGGAGPRILIPEDRSWDPVTLSTVLEALSAAPAQVIVATTTEPRKVPEGWTVIRTGSAPWHTGIEFATLRAPPATNVPLPPVKFGPAIVTTNLVKAGELGQAILDAEDTLSDLTAIDEDGLEPVFVPVSDLAPVPRGHTTPDEGDFIAVGVCPHDISGSYCTSCKVEREAREGKERAVKEARENERRARAEMHAAGKHVPHTLETAASPPTPAPSTEPAPAPSEPTVKRGRGRPKGSKNKTKPGAASDASIERELAPAVSQDQGTTPQEDPPLLE